VFDGLIYGLVIAHFEVEAWMVLAATPVPSKKCFLSNKVQSARDWFAIPFAHDEQNVFPECVMRDLKKFSSQVR